MINVDIDSNMDICNKMSNKTVTIVRQDRRIFFQDPFILKYPTFFFIYRVISIKLKYRKHNAEISKTITYKYNRFFLTIVSTTKITLCTWLA